VADRGKDASMRGASAGMANPARPFRLIVGGSYGHVVEEEGTDARRRLQETLLFLRGQQAALTDLPGGSFYASVLGTWILFLEKALERLP
jgi:hypothetical protein